MFGKIFINSSIGVLIHIQAQTYLTLQLQVNILLKFVESGSGINILSTLPGKFCPKKQEFNR